MKKLFEEDDEGQDRLERARIFVVVIPVVLILLILAFMLIKSRMDQGKEDRDDLQQRMKPMTAREQMQAFRPILWRQPQSQVSRRKAMGIRKP